MPSSLPQKPSIALHELRARHAVTPVSEFDTFPGTEAQAAEIDADFREAALRSFNDFQPPREDPKAHPEIENASDILLYDPDSIPLPPDESCPEFFSTVDRFRMNVLQGPHSTPIRYLRHATPTMLTQLIELRSAMPHLGAVTDIITRQIQLSLMADTPIKLPPLLLVGQAGIGKTRFMRQLSRCLDLPFRRANFNSTSLDSYFNGANPSWKDANAGVVARALLDERIANPIFLVDEFDKVPPQNNAADPYRPFYTLLEPEAAETFVDEFLQFPIRADHVLWIMTANSAEALPEPIADRLLTLEIPAPTTAQMRVIATSIYTQINKDHRDRFEPEISSDCLDILAATQPRRARLLAATGLAYAAADRRNYLTPQDLVAAAELLDRKSRATAAGFIANL